MRCEAHSGTGAWHNGVRAHLRPILPAVTGRTDAAEVHGQHATALLRQYCV